MSYTKFVHALLFSIVILAAAPHAFTQTYSVLYSFTGGKDGASPVGGVILDGSGNLYGTTGGGSRGGAQGGTVFKISPTTGTFTLLHTFNKHGVRGAYPSGGLVQDNAGNLYGATSDGGASEYPNCFVGGTGYNLPSNGCGAIFKVDARGRFSVLFSFSGYKKCWNGCSPLAPLTLDSTGNLYGTTFIGGSDNCSPYKLNVSGGMADTDCGVVFKLDPTGKETVLRRFGNGRKSGDSPNPGLVLDSAGNLYGTTQGGGVNGNGGAGTIFKLDSAGNETVLHFFVEFVDGDSPRSGLTRDSAGNFYGTTAFGGDPGWGSIFRLDTNGNFTQMFNFSCCSGGVWPFGGLVIDASQNLYGTTFAGGNQAPTCGFEGCGVIFKVDIFGNETVLHSFTGGADGGSPEATLVRDAAGNLYGTAPYGGVVSKVCPTGCGVIFKITP